MMGKSQRQPADGQRLLSGQKLSMHGIAALTIQNLAGAKRPLSGRNDIGIHADCRARGLITQGHRATEMPTSKPIKCQRL